MGNFVIRTEADTATVPLYIPARVKAMPMEAGGVAVLAVVPAASGKVHNILEASRGCYSWVIARVLG